MARDCPIRVEIGIGFCCCCCCMHEFPQTLVKVCVFLVCGCFWGGGDFLENWCVCGVSFFVPKYHKCLGISGYIHLYIKLQSETLKLPVQNPHILHR